MGKKSGSASDNTLSGTFVGHLRFGLQSALYLLLFAFFLSGFLGCSSHTAGLTPQYPMDKQIVDTLDPTISWKDLVQYGSSYDVVIYEKLDEGDVQAYGGARKKNPKKEVFYQEGIEGTELVLTDVLKPNKTYYWSVRARDGQNVSDWSMNETQVFTGISYHRRTNLYEFRSPNE